MNLRAVALRRRLRWLWVGVLGALLLGCGGGGGGDGGGSGGGGGPPPAGPTGLVPAAPAAGAVVVADSRNYRPLIAGARWNYRQFVRGTGTPLDRSVTHAIDGSAGMREIDVNGFDPAVNLQRNAAGDTVATTALEITSTRSVTISGPELTRELRAGQQIVSFDARVADVGDLDGDGRSDGLDVAVWRTVAGLEDVALPASTAPVRALRVDERFVLRTVPTGGGAAQRIEGRGTSWYADGVGLVRTLTLAADGVTPDDDLRLTGFDGGSRGLGLLTLGEGRAYVQQDAGRALVLGEVSLNIEDSLSITRRDNRGRLLATLASRRDGDDGTLAQRLLQTRDGPRLISLPSFSLSGRVLLDALDAEGRLSGARLAAFDVAGETAESCGSTCLRVSSHASSAVIWMVSAEVLSPSPGVFERPLTVRRLGSDGVLRGEPVRYVPPFSSSFLTLRVLDAVARPSGLSVLLSENDGGSDTAMRLVEFDEAGAVVLSRRYKPAVSGFSPDLERARVLVDGDARWLAWRSSSDGMPRAVRLAADGTPVGVADTAEGLASARLDALPEAMRSQWPYNVTSFGGNWWIGASEVSSALLDILGDPTRHVVIARIDPREEAGLRGAPALLRTSSSFDIGLQGLVFADRVLWGGDFGGLGFPVLYWR